MAAYHKVEVSLNTNAVEVGIPSPQTVNVVVPTIGPAGPVGSVGPVGPTGPQGVPGTGLEVLTTQGDLLYQGASTGQRLAIGTSGQILRVANGIPSWGNESGAVTSVNGETGAVILDGSEIESSANDVRAAFTMSAFDDGDGIYYPLPDLFINTKPVYSTTSGYSVFFENARWHITDGSPITANIIESSDNDNAAWPWLSAWSGDVDKAKIADVIGRARDTFLFVGDNLKVGTSSGLPLKTGSGGAVEAGSFSNTAGSFCAGDDARLSDARTPSSTLAHKASHAINGTDFLAPSDIGAQSLFTSEGIVLSANVTLASSRAKKWRIQNYNGTTYSITLPTTGVQEGDVVVITTGTLVGSQTIREDAGGGNFVALATISEGQSYRFISTGTLSSSWEIDQVYTHTHVVADVTGAAASGSITTSGLTQATARILGRTTASTGAIEEIQIGSGLSLSAGELSATGSGVTAVGTTLADILSVSGSDLVADDLAADKLYGWDDSESKAIGFIIGSGLSVSGDTLSATASGGSKTYAVFTAEHNQPPATAFATLDTRNSIAVLDFDAATDESAVFVGVIPEGASLGSGLKVFIHWMASTATSGNCRWGVQFEKSGTDLDSDSFDTATEAHSAANGTSGIETVTEITATAIDSLAAGDRFRLKVFRNADDATNDTMTGDAELIAVEVRSAA
jgi:hypothetical protein